MEPASLLPPFIAETLARGGTVVTANQRAARTLRRAFDRQSRAAGKITWQPPRILPWDAWIAALWRRLTLEGPADRLLLNQSQELQVWSSIILEDGAENRVWSSLQTIDSLAALAAEAWRSLCQYNGQQRLRNAGATEDTRAFQRWAQAFRRRSVADRTITPPELEEFIAAIVKLPGFILSERKLLLVGFDRRTPAQLALLNALRDFGISIVVEPRTSSADQRYVAAATDPGEEVTNAALWIRETLTGNPEARIAVIVPDLASDRAEIDRVFRQVLAPELQSITAGDRGGPFEFSLGEPLGRVPMVVAALAILRLASGALPIEEISRLLLSPYFVSAQSEHSARAEFDAFHLRKANLLQPEVTLEALIKLAGKAAPLRLAGLLNQLHSLRHTVVKLLSEPEKQKSYGDWAETIPELLRNAAWATGRPDSSVEYQGRRKWESALDELTTLDFAGGRRTFAEASAALEAILARTLFAPESRDAPVQIMGPHEAAGSRFDAIWFLRASDLDWPVRPGTSPLLGWQLQRDLGMPGSDPGLDRAHARHVMQRIAASAASIVFSYASETSEGQQRPSPLFAELDLRSLEFIHDEAGPAAPVALETFEDCSFIPLSELTVRGGAALLKAQAACGFRAFAEQRLFATPIDSATPGMDARESGNVIHIVMEHLWSELRTQAALRTLTPEQRANQLDRSIRHGLKKITANAVSSWDAAYISMQQERLRTLLTRWLDLELMRSAFEVRQREQDFEDIAIGPLRLSIRVDRIDRLLDEAGGEVLLDYKTGEVSHKDWATDRPEEPQLPLYAVLREPGSVAAVAFATIRAGNKMELHGYAARDGALPKSVKMDSESLDAQLEDWHRVLTALAEGFAAGDARVRPKKYPVTCKYCAHRLLCRLDPSLLLGEPDETNTSEEDHA